MSKKQLVIVAAIGTSEYQNVEYKFEDGSTVPAKYFLLGLVDRLKPDAVIVLLTEEARILQWENPDSSGIGDLLKKRDLSIADVDIPKGANEAEAWQIFEHIAANIPSGAEVVIDITHGLRSIPVLMLLATFYLQNVKNVTIRDIFYGALEGVERSENTKPAYSLGHFLTLLDWSGGVELFKRTGDAKKLAELLEDRQNTLHARGKKQSDEKLPVRLKSLAASLDKLSHALGVIRPIEIMEEAAQVQQNLERAAEESQVWAKPFALVFDELKDAFVPLSLTDPLEYSKRQRFIQTQVEMVGWYIRYEQFDAASLLLRELIVNWYLFTKKKADISDIKVREEAEDDLNRLDKRDRLGNLWGLVRDIRNDIAHTGMRRNPMPSKRLSDNITKAFEDFKNLWTTGNNP